MKGYEEGDWFKLAEDIHCEVLKPNGLHTPFTIRKGNTGMIEKVIDDNTFEINIVPDDYPCGVPLEVRKDQITPVTMKVDCDEQNKEGR